MTEQDLRTGLLRVTALASEYCITVENASEMEVNEFVLKMLNLLPRLYVEFLDIAPAGKGQNEEEKDDSLSADGYISLGEEESPYFAEYVDEDYYNNIRRHIETLLGPDDVFLETFEEDMKYSDTPIAASISESLADIFQPLYNFISIVRDSEGDYLEAAYMDCRDNFAAYWSRNLCNVMRALNNVYFK